MGNDDIDIFSANVRGLRQQFKRRDIFDYIKNLKSDIICLQETHLIQKDLTMLSKEWNLDYYIAGSSTNSRGVMVMINNTFEHTVKQCIKDPEGRFLILELSITNLINVFIINLYAPNRDDPVWFSALFEKVKSISNNCEIWTGDWNAALSEADIYNYAKLRNPLASQIINKFISTHNLSDIWRLLNPNRKRFTWRADKPCRASRLDYFLISEDILSLNPKSFILNAYKSDHNIIKLSIQKSGQKRGKGLWKFNNALLENLEFVDMIKAEILLINQTYALPVYSEAFVARDNGETIDISISSTLFLETFLCQLRGKIIKFSKTLKKQETEAEDTLVSSIKKLQEEIDSDNDNLIKKNSLRELSLQLENLREKKIKGCIVRSRASLTDTWEKPSKYFLNLEKRNHVNKNIPSLLHNDSEITDSAAILELQRDFYADLYSSKETVVLENSKFSQHLHNLPSLSEINKTKLDAPYTIEELLRSIKASKLNKAPGPDGYSNEFFKFFINELHFWIYRYILEAISHSHFSKLALDGVITCIPKQGKLRNDLKNWRPLTLLNSIYKFFSSMVANRLKCCLPSIINEDQTGFISGRFIGENTRMVFDTIEYCDSHDTPGLLLVLDFSKAFDTIEWKFIKESLELFNFGNNFIEMIKLCQYNSTSKVEQNGFLSSPIILERGCRQGDPLSPYIFVICAEVLSHVIREMDVIRGIEVHGEEAKVSQYADDTTLLLREDVQTITSVIRVLKWFKNVSGLDINKEKTKVVKLGALRDSNIKWQGKFGFNWSTKFEILGIHYDMTKLNAITDLNIQRKLGEIQQLIRIWSSRNLTPYGKVTIIKSLLIPKITHMLLSLPSPSPSCFKEINDVITKFLWCGKPPKWKKEILEGEIPHGGLKLHDLNIFDKALKLSWLKRYQRSTSKWTIFPNNFDLWEVFTYGPDILDKLRETTANQFWLDVLESLSTLWNSDAMTEKPFIKNTPIWLNPTFAFPIKKQWFSKGITMVSDFLGVMNVIMPIDLFMETYGLKTNFLEYHYITHRISKFIEWKDMPLYDEDQPKNGSLNIFLNQTLKGVSCMYSRMKNTSSSVLDTAVDKWCANSELDFNNFDLSRSFQKHHLIYKDTYLKYIQFRTLHHRFFTNEKLFKMGKKISDLCGFCRSHSDSIEHMFLDCEIVIQLWNEVQEWIQALGMNNYNLSQSKIILGDLENAMSINTIILLTKKVIYNAMKKEQSPHLLNVKNEVKKFYYDEKYRCRLIGKDQLFEKQYHLLSNIYVNPEP